MKRFRRTPDQATATIMQSCSEARPGGCIRTAAYQRLCPVVAEVQAARQPTEPPAVTAGVGDRRRCRDAAETVWVGGCWPLTRPSRAELRRPGRCGATTGQVAGFAHQPAGERATCVENGNPHPTRTGVRPEPAAGVPQRTRLLRKLACCVRALVVVVESLETEFVALRVGHDDPPSGGSLAAVIDHLGAQRLHSGDLIPLGPFPHQKVEVHPGSSPSWLRAPRRKRAGLCHGRARRPARRGCPASLAWTTASQ